MQYRILGPLEVVVDGRSLDVGPRKQRSLFALLLIHHNRIVSTDRILDALWGEDSLGKENALWVYISRLRSILAEVTADEILVTKDHGYSLEIESNQLDSHEFEQLTTAGLATLDADPVEAAQILRRALELWRGTPLEDFAYDEFARSEISRLGTLRQTCLDARIEAELRCGRGGELVAEIEQQLDERPYDETPIRQLMLALYRSGRQTESLRAFERYRRRLGEDTGTEPSPELCRLEEQILVHDERLTHAEDKDSDTTVNPYRGLEVFREEDSHLFFGRDRTVADTLVGLSQHSIVTVEGPSGSGKSSVVRAGVIPAIRKQALPGSDRWLIASMIPGSHPFVELEAALLRSRLDAPDSLRDQLDGSSNEILRAALRVAPEDDSTILIFVDQFEELFTACPPAVADRFLDAIVECSRDPRRRVRCILTLRADFYDRPLRHASFGATMARGIVNVVPMAPEDLEQAATGPAGRAGVRLEPGLEAAIIGDVLGQPGALPLFELALTDLFDRRIGDTLTLAAYRSMGGIEGSISRKAENIYASLSPTQQAAAHQTFLRLVSISDAETRSRRRVQAGELLGLDIDVADIQTALGAFGSQRLLSFDRSEVTGSPTVEVAHEALIERWERLAAWIAEAKDDVLRNARITSLAAEWEEHDRDHTYLLSRGRFDDYAAWATSSTMTLGRPERDFLDASRQAHDDDDRHEAERRDREAAVARRARRNAFGLIGVLLAVAVVASLLVWRVVQPVGPTVALFHGAQDDAGIPLMVLNGFQRAAAELAIVARNEALQAGMEDRMRTVAEQGTELIIAGMDYGPIVNSINADYPETDFLVLDSQGYPDENVTVVDFDQGAGAYLMGVVAALTTETDTVGLIIGTQSSFMVPFAGGFDAGVTSVDTDIEVFIDFVASDMTPIPGMESLPPVLHGFGRDDLAYEAAMYMFDNGADVIFTAAGEAGQGSIRAATEYTEAHDRAVWAIGVDVDEGFITDDRYSGRVLTSMVKRYDEAVYQAIEVFLADDLPERIVLDFTNGGIEYSDFGGHVDAIADDLDAVVEQISRGEVLIPWAPTTQPSWRTPASDVVTVTYDGTHCLMDRTPQLFEGEIGDFVIINDSDDWADFGVGLLPSGVSAAQIAATDPEFAGAGDALEANGGQSGYTWTVAPGGRYELRSQVLGAPFGAAGVACWPSHDWGDLSNTDLFEVLSP